MWLSTQSGRGVAMPRPRAFRALQRSSEQCSIRQHTVYSAQSRFQAPSERQNNDAERIPDSVSGGFRPRPENRATHADPPLVFLKLRVWQLAHGQRSSGLRIINRNVPGREWHSRSSLEQSRSQRVEPSSYSIWFLPIITHLPAVRWACPCTTHETKIIASATACRT